MRRKERGITDPIKIKEIIDACHCCRIGFYDQGQVYIVPLNFGYILEDGNYVFYFHGAKAGRKIDLIQSSPSVGFELDTHYKLNEGVLPCQYSARYQSIIGNGTVSIVENIEEKKLGLLALMKQTTQKEDWVFSDQMAGAVCVFKLVVESMSCKEHQ
ncbi:MAG: pyridoxamine 5'-phosphate oxidase family protein [Cellulosilyticaceae bacterium]